MILPSAPQMMNAARRLPCQAETPPLRRRRGEGPAGASKPHGALNEVIGPRELSAWQPVPGVTWVQARSPQFARKLSQRADSRLVVRGVAGGYLRTFEFQRGPAWARRLIERYTRNETPTNARKIAPACPPRRRNAQGAYAGGFIESPAIRKRTPPALHFISSANGV
jgi:hypothetical protein